MAPGAFLLNGNPGNPNPHIPSSMLCRRPRCIPRDGKTISWCPEEFSSLFSTGNLSTFIKGNKILPFPGMRFWIPSPITPRVSALPWEGFPRVKSPWIKSPWIKYLLVPIPKNLSHKGSWKDQRHQPLAANPNLQQRSRARGTTSNQKIPSWIKSSGKAQTTMEWFHLEKTFQTITSKHHHIQVFLEFPGNPFQDIWECLPAEERKLQQAESKEGDLQAWKNLCENSVIKALFIIV